MILLFPTVLSSHVPLAPGDKIGFPENLVRLDKSVPVAILLKRSVWFISI